MTSAGKREQTTRHGFYGQSSWVWHEEVVDLLFRLRLFSIICPFDFNETTDLYNPIATSLSRISDHFSRRSTVMNPISQCVVAAILSFVTVTVILGLLLRLCDKRERKGTKTRYLTQRDINLSSISINESIIFDPTLPHISMEELVTATNNFSDDVVIGVGGFGFVYKARLKNDVLVAVKKLSGDAFQGSREFRAEVETLGKIRHKNLVKILGYCSSGRDRILIYEFLENGSLDQWLYDDTNNSLNWETRVKIIKGVAAGLDYLHNECNPHIIHRDIKASNVLLDSSFEAHIADFGLARRMDDALTHVSTQVAGTAGYMPPEYMSGYTQATVKADVYSFGVLMFEIASGTRPNWPVKIEGKDMGLVERGRMVVKEGKEMEMIDELIRNKGLPVEEVQRFFLIACECTCEKPGDRPLMKEIVSLLDRI